MDMETEKDIETEIDMETETDMETEMETDNIWTWTWPQTQTWTWNGRTFAKYFILAIVPIVPHGIPLNYPGAISSGAIYL
jgi:hypothetical protein